DRIAQELGVARDGPTRIQAGFLQAMQDASDSGHVSIPLRAATSRALALLELDDADPNSEEKIGTAIDALWRGGYVVRENSNDGEPLVFLSDLHAAETRFAQRLLGLARAPARPLSGAARSLTEF